MASIILFTLCAVFLSSGSCAEYKKNEIHITDARIEQSRIFLLQCSFMKKNWHRQWIRLQAEHFNVITPPFIEQGICARFVHGLLPMIVVYADANSLDCYWGSMMLLLAHEMLHQVGLPPHGPDNIPDAIETVITDCTEEYLSERN